MGTYTNPILPSFNPDPSIVRVGSSYYMVTSTFEFFPGLPIYHSTDLIRWTLINHAISRPSQLRIATPEPGGGLWAPTIRHRAGTFYVLCASFDRYRPQADDRVWPQGFYVATRDITDPRSWSDPVFFDQVGFDQDLFWDDADGGAAWLSTTYRRAGPRTGGKDFAIHVARVDLETGASLSAPVCVRESPSGVAEGSHIIKRGEWYYLFTAEGGTESGHSEWVLRSREGPLGPWELGPCNPLWRNTTADEVQNTGHADLVEDESGRWWAVLLAVRPRKGEDGKWEASMFGRETFLVPVEWDADGWPVFNDGKKIGLEGEATGTGVYKLDQEVSWADDFTSDELQLGWYRKNTPLRVDHCIDSSKQVLRLHGGPYALSSPASPTMYLRKQFLRQGIWTTRLRFQPSSPACEAGACVYWNYFTFASIGIRCGSTADQRVIRLSIPDPDSKSVKQEDAVVVSEAATLKPDTDIILSIKCLDHGYQFGYKEVAARNTDNSHISAADDDSNGITWLEAIVATSTMTRDPPVGAPFTGMMLGVYAFGENQRCLDPADFHYAQFDGAL